MYFFSFFFSFSIALTNLSANQNEEGVRLYHQIVGPLLQLLAAILNALSTSPVATSQISIFIQNHFELFRYYSCLINFYFSIFFNSYHPMSYFTYFHSMSLRENVVTLEGLKKLELVTRIFLLTLRSNVERNVCLLSFQILERFLTLTILE